MWYVLKTAEGKEEKACEACRRAFPAGSYSHVFVPYYVSPYHRDGQWSETRKPLFPGYIFADADESGAEEIKDILLYHIPNIAKPVCVGDDFVPIYSDEQELLESLMDKDHIVGISNGNLVDNRVVVDEGPLRGYADKVCWFDRHKRMASIETSLHGNKRRIKMGLLLVNRINTKAG